MLVWPLAVASCLNGTCYGGTARSPSRCLEVGDKGTESAKQRTLKVGFRGPTDLADDEAATLLLDSRALKFTDHSRIRESL